ncbi:hypothetical protein TWF106_002643 [Orbilia oligospora]|uniref:Uncharacterized protein n=1 Tax=Orbilia oligospora TaxID=2813651 RepID=A0A6G1M1V3_ORBOL|nr:hypothetical protein TWF788_005348 [Orbilia oligospora]KAF3201921.1 hypothetical protein TWF106_002643 [Orbilia oligospora]KAF3221464.1 hypothetical protein TWF679_008152 [Orbilia oligospora]KAF3232387.1 hypothetical protein TWF191_000159 [Orbilia oligospora]KAF3242397.1 hypothetical protein TWF192_008653 [Orbilia oligospora]
MGGSLLIRQRRLLGSVSEAQVQISRATHIDSIDGPHKNSGRRICFGIVVPRVTNCSLKLHHIENLNLNFLAPIIPDSFKVDLRLCLEWLHSPFTTQYPSKPAKYLPLSSMILLPAVRP